MAIIDCKSFYSKLLRIDTAFATAIELGRQKHVAKHEIYMITLVRHGQE